MTAKKRPLTTETLARLQSQRDYVLPDGQRMCLTQREYEQSTGYYEDLDGGFANPNGDSTPIWSERRWACLKYQQ